MKVSLLTTTFPKSSETFLQREVALLRTSLEELELISIHGGDPFWQGTPVVCFSKWRLFSLPFWIPYWLLRRPAAVFRTLRDLTHHRCPSWLNFQETMLGLAFAFCTARAVESRSPAWHHAVWATMPATAALLYSRLLDRPFSMEAHAYDIFQRGGDWLIGQKMAAAAWIRTSTVAGFERLLALGATPDRILTVRRGLSQIPELLSAWPRENQPLQLVSAGRFVPKKGLFNTLRIAAALKHRQFHFHLQMIGDGPLSAALRNEAKRLELDDCVSFPGFLEAGVFQTRLQSMHLLLFCGETAPDGDRDGLPNVIPEAMANGVLILTTSAGATEEAVTHCDTGFILSADHPQRWVDTIQELCDNPDLYAGIRRKAHQWVVANYDSTANLRPLLAALKTGNLP